MADPRSRAPQLHPHTPGARAVIGFLSANIHIGAGRSVWPGIVDAAQQHDLNLICFPGGGLHVAESFEAQRNVIYNLVDPAWLNGIVSWSSTISVKLEPAEVVEFHQRFQPLPIVSLAQIIEGVPTLSIDSYHGMRAAISHLIEVHGYRRLAFIRGPASHFYAQERYRAYVDVLQEHGLPLLPELVTPPLNWEAGAEAVPILLDDNHLRPGVDFEAVVAVSDLLALAAMKAFQARGIQIPRDLAFVGFNDSIEGRSVTPPLTSVTMPFYAQGARAVETLAAQMAGAEVPAQVVLQSRLIVRQSCGCPSEAVRQAAAGRIEPSGVDLNLISPALRTAFLSDLTAISDGSAPITQQAGRLFDAFQADRVEAEPRSRFLSELDQIIEETSRIEGDVAVWQDIISILRRRWLPYLTDAMRGQAEDSFGQARVLIGEAAQRAQAYAQWQVERQAEMLRQIGQALITTFNVNTLTDVLAERLPSIGIRSCYLALYENPAVSLDQARLVLGYTEGGRIALEAGGRNFASRQLVPPGLLPQGRQYSLLVEPLFFREEQIGFVVFEIGPRDGVLYEVLRGHISSALKGALLYTEAQQARLAAEKADQIKTRLLTNVSHELRTPLNIILDTTRNAQRLTAADEAALLADLQHIQHNAEHQLRVINDLLDLSRAEIDELDLYLELIDPRPLLAEAFHSLADSADPNGDIVWRLQLPDRLPWLNADAVRLRQILLNLMSNARKFTERGEITLAVEVLPPHLHLWVADTGTGIPAEQQTRIFEPFVTAEHDRVNSGIGLGLSITRHLVALHGGSMALDSEPGQGSTFHIFLPLPRLSDQPTHPIEAAQPVVLCLSAHAQPAAEIVEFAQRQTLELRRLRAGDDLEVALANIQPVAFAWDLVEADPGDWAIVRRLRNHPRLSQVPFILYGQMPKGEPDENTLAIGLTSFVGKPANSQALLDAINASCPADSAGSILIVDDDVQACEAYQKLVAQGLPGYPIRVANDGAAALAIMVQEVPSLVILDLMMPGVGGAEVLDRMRADPRLRQVPVVIISSKLLNLDDVKRLERHARVMLQSKGVLSEAETIAALNRALFGADSLPSHTSALVKRAIAYLHQNYTRPLARWEIAEAIGVSEDYLSRVFSRELGLSPWEYLNRYRVNRAKELLARTDANIRSVAHQVGFRDQAYFSRVFRKLTGQSPNAFREQPSV